MRSLIGLVALGLVVGCSGSSGSKADIKSGGDTVDGTGGGDLGSGEVAEDLTEDRVEELAEPIDWDAVFGSPDTAGDGKRRLVILHTNDLHSHLNGTGPLKDFSPSLTGNDSTLGGMSRIATMVEKERRSLPDGADLILVDAGDFTVGSAFATLTRSHGVELKIMDQIGYVGTTIGNHELDWTPAGAAALVDVGLEGAANLHVLASNLVFSDTDPKDDALAALVGTKILRHKVVSTSNGLKVGLFGLLGKGALQLAPHAAPVKVADPEKTAREMVALLREEEQVDIVVALSHAGVSENDDLKGEDETIASKVDGLNVIVSGHSHTLMEQPLELGDTLVVQAGKYSEYLGKLVLVETAPGVFEMESWRAIPVDDALPGWTAVQAVIKGWEKLLNDALFPGLPHGYRDAVAHTDFDIPTAEFQETPVGNLISDAIRHVVGQYSSGGAVDVAIEANGVIRNGFLAGKTGAILLADILRVVPLGIGPDGKLGYPLLGFWVTAREIRLALEVICGVAPAFADSYFLQVSGVKFECIQDGKMFEQVGNVWLGNDQDGYSPTPLDTSADNKTLYHVSTNLYIAQMMSVLKNMTGGLLAIELKDKDGVVRTNVEEFIVTMPGEGGTTQELKLWRAVYEYLAAFPVVEGGSLPQIPSRYSTPAGRQINK
jgi:5'-nucleotidase